MNFTVHELPRAKADKRHILLWLLERSPQGGKAWLTAYDDALVTLADNADSFGEALENKDCPLLDIKQTFFKTRRGRVYRLLYFIEGSEVYILRVRGPGQAPIDPQELQP
jgi:mRNA-degrading endonuclease RelE of RelBE toxin-antitoxin system